MNTGTRTAAINILFALDILFFATAIALSLMASSAGVADKAWEAFAGANGALLLILKADNDNPTQPVDPAQRK